MLKDRMSLEFTYFNKETKDALIRRNVDPSAGASDVQFFNLGRVKNYGVEMAINTRVIDGQDVSWDLALSGSVYDNNLAEIGQGVGEIVFGPGPSPASPTPMATASSPRTK
jgi:outer membrane receptor protein involved in Fe transport